MDLHAKVEAAVLEEVGRVGVDGFDRAALVRRFEGHGASPRTLYRWIGVLFESGRIGQHLARTVQEAVAARSAASPDPAAEAAREVGEILPRLASPGEIAAGGGPIAVMALLQNCVQAAVDTMRHAKTDDGRVRNSKLLLAASAELRKCLETTVRIFETMREVSHVDRLHAEIIEEIGRESPELAERVLRRLDQFCSRFDVAPEAMR